MQVNSYIFREYDIRGVVGVDLSVEFAFALGHAFSLFLASRNILNCAVGEDCRTTSSSYAAALADGLRQGGCSVIQLGVGPTPRLYWSLARRLFAAGVQVTGSHNPPDMNGFKLCAGSSPLTGMEIQELRGLIKKLQAGNVPAANVRADLSQQCVDADYITDLAENCRPYMGSRRLKVVVDGGNGVGGLITAAVLRALGIEVLELNCEPDGRFPNHHPDPVQPENLRQLAAAVCGTQADIGMALDGDGDRIGAVDEKGGIIPADLLLLLYARQVLKEKPGAVIIGDVKCTQSLFDDVRGKGGKIFMYKTGHSVMKRKLHDIRADLAGELSGHIIFGHRFYGFDDAAYCAARLAEIMSNTSIPASQLLEDLPARYASPEIRVPCLESVKFQIAGKLQELFADQEVCAIDGVRITLSEGWMLLRPSNTEPVMVLRVEATSAAKLKEYQQLLEDKLHSILQSL